jgi:hypothetical protein
MHSTNYFNAFILVADDCPAKEGKMPPVKAEAKTIANLQFEMLYERPYQYTSDEVLFDVYTRRKKLLPEAIEQARAQYFSKGQPCFRASPLTKQYGWGMHANSAGKIAIFGVESTEYQNFLENDGLRKIKAMRLNKVKD